MEVLCIIPARGGSKGIPRKNIYPLRGIPLLVHSIRHAWEAPSISRVVVSTDDPEIAGVAEEAHAEVVRRPPAISGDTATSESALLHTLDHLKDSEGYEPDLVVFLQATSPLRKQYDIQQTIEVLQREKADSAFSAVPVHGFIWRSSSEQITPINYHPVQRPPRQEIIETFLEENGSIYIFKPSVLRTYGSRLGGKIAIHEMDRLDSFQVDEPGDLELLERLLALERPEAQHADLAAICLLVLDFDGVMTDNRVFVAEDGHEGVWCHRGDGWGIARLKEAGIEVIVLSTETNPVVGARCRKLGVDCIQGSDDKLTALKKMVTSRALQVNQVAYVGNGVNDLSCLEWVGVPIIVADAEPEVRHISALVTNRKGGQGAVQEVARWILASRGG